jgi:very-short-patch-repair endonuclease
LYFSTQPPKNYRVIDRLRVITDGKPAPDPYSFTAVQIRKFKRKQRKARKAEQRRFHRLGKIQKPVNTQGLSAQQKLYAYAARMRDTPTPAECRIRSAVASLGIRYNHQLVFERIYRIVDFYLPEYLIAIEADGKQHYTKDGIEADAERDSQFKAHYPDVRFIRMSNAEIMNRDKHSLKAELQRRINVASASRPKPAQIPPP